MAARTTVWSGNPVGRHGGRARAGTLWAVVSAALLAAVLSAAGPSAAELTEADRAATGPRAEAVDRAFWGEGLQSEITYLRPSAPFSADADSTIAVPAPPALDDRERTRLIWGAIAAAIIIFVIVLIVSNAGGMAVRFARPDEGRRRDDAARQGPLGVPADDQPLDGFLKRLAAMADKRAALILLVSRALEAAADSNDVRLGRAQTARDVVRALPRGWRHHAAMRDLVREVELVHFGGRPVTPERWQDCLDRALPILGRLKVRPA